MPRRTERMIAGHVRNIRCMWIKMLGKPHGIRARWQWSKRAKEAAARRR